MPLDEVDSPALMIDLNAFEHNLRRIPETIASSPVKARTHAKWRSAQAGRSLC
jgi:3-hydroxy-D-aspartate aldolase